MRPDEVDLRWISALLYRNAAIEETGVAAGILNHPTAGVAWLANKLHQHDTSLEAGAIILAGSFTRPVQITRGDSVLCDHGLMGTISCRFSRVRPSGRRRPSPTGRSPACGSAPAAR